MKRKSIQTFLSTDSLEKNLSNSQYKIVDLRDAGKFERGHIQGSVHIDNNVFAKQDDDGFNTLPDKEELLGTLKEKGINKKDIIVFVDDVFNLNCSLAAWTLHYFGFYNVKLLDGAFAKWEIEKKPLTSELSKFPKGSIELKEENSSILVTKDEILMNYKSEDFLFVDNRSEYALVLDQQGGNIPGAIHFWYLDIFEEYPDYFILKDCSIIEDELLSRNIAKDKTIVVYCESAPQSALVYLALKELGYPDVRLYLAGYEEWRIICSFLG